MIPPCASEWLRCGTFQATIYIFVALTQASYYKLDATPRTRHSPTGHAPRERSSSSQETKLAGEGCLHVTNNLSRAVIFDKEQNSREALALAETVPYNGCLRRRAGIILDSAVCTRKTLKGVSVARLRGSRWARKGRTRKPEAQPRPGH